uniref:IBH1-like N-terminal domain-containing protein n=1 Tax=Oryza meridionalis TaxID=40149 RepID=A0A0E0E4K2_9ORYZ
MGGPGASSTMSFEQAFLKNLLLSLQDCSTTKPLDAMGLHERKRAVKSSADFAMATARGGGARWPKAIVLQQPPASMVATTARARRCRRIVRRCCGRKARSGAGGEIARRLVRRRGAMALRKVIPGGGDAMDEAALLREAMDYVVHLRAQVDVLRRVSEAVQLQRRSTSSTSLRDYSWSKCASKGEEDSSMNMNR